MPVLTKDNILKEIWSLPDNFATSLVAVLMDTFGTEFLTWAPQTIIMEIESTYGVVPTVDSVDRLMAGVNLLTSNRFYAQLADFNDLCNILSGEPATPGYVTPADSMSIAWGITEALFLSPPDDLDNAFTPEIIGFISETLSHEGILIPPDVLNVAKIDKDALLQQVHYDYSDDPEMFQGIFDTEKSKTDDINYFIKTRLKALVNQISMLPLKHGNPEQVAEMMLKSLEAAHRRTSELP